MRGSALSSVSTSQPSRRGSRMSSTTAAGSERRTRSRASTPSWARMHPGWGAGEVGRHQVERGPVVVDEQHDRQLIGSVPAVRLGSGRRVQREWRTRRCCRNPRCDSSHIRPPNSSTIRRDSVRPRPVPSSFGAPRPPCWKDSKIRSRSSRRHADAGVGDDHRRARVPTGDAWTETLPPSGVNLTALDTRLSTTCLNLSSSASIDADVVARRRGSG